MSIKKVQKRISMMLIPGFILLLFIITACGGGGGGGEESEELTYTVTYLGNGNIGGGSVPVDNTKYETGAKITVLGNTGNLVNTGSFKGWNTASDGSGKNYTQGETFLMDSSDVTLYAMWHTSMYAVGDIGPAGGYIFYDKGSYSDGWRYLEVSLVSTEWTDKEWGNYGFGIQGPGGTALGVAIGTGKANTAAIVAWLDANTDNSSGDVTYRRQRAAYLCDQLTSNGYSDWFLPSKEELNMIYTNLKLAIPSLGNLSDSYYWSSTEVTAPRAWVQYFGTGAQSYDFKDDNIPRTRAIRDF